MEEHEDERRQLEAAVTRLISGVPVRSSGHFTVVALAQESQIKRTRLYEQYPDVIDAFRRRAGHIPPPPALEALQGEIESVRAENNRLHSENAQLRERIRTLSALTAELALQAEARGGASYGIPSGSRSARAQPTDERVVELPVRS